MKKKPTSALLFLLLFLAACSPPPKPAPEPAPRPQAAAAFNNLAAKSRIKPYEMKSLHKTTQERGAKEYEDNPIGN
jgi:hypothetical protein